jgi:RND family efflux transporter MFP subunit
MEQLLQKKWLINTLAITILLIIVLFSLGIIGGPDKIPAGNTANHLNPLPTGAKTLKVGKATGDNRIAWPGTIKSRSVAKIAPKFSGRILEVKVNAGNRVKQGDIVAVLDKSDLEAAYQEAQSALSAARAQATRAVADEKRIINLFKQGAATRQSYDAIIAQARSARAMVSQALGTVKKIRANLNENILKAPFDGVVSERLQEPGDMGLPGMPVVVIQKANDLRAEAAIPTHCAKRIHLGMNITIRVDAVNKTFTGIIDEIVPEIDPLTRTQLIKAALPQDDSLVPGLFAWLEQSCEDNRQILLIPQSAVMRFGQLEAVKIVENNHVYTRHIRTGKQYGDKVEVLSGLREGETILINTGLQK